MPDSYHANPIVQAHPDEPVLPLGLFVDATPYSLTDSVLGFWTVCLVTGRRWLSAALRKKVCCKCGCRGWCAYDVVVRFLRWSIAILGPGHGKPRCGNVCGTRILDCIYWMLYIDNNQQCVLRQTLSDLWHSVAPTGEKRRPIARHDGKPWFESDMVRRTRTGSVGVARYCLQYVK